MKGNNVATARKNAAKDETTVDSAVPEVLSNKELTTKRAFSDDVLRGITTIEEAMALVAETYGGITHVDELELGNGFRLLGEDKDRLIGVPFVILTFGFNEGDFGEFASVLLVTDRSDRIILNDGSTGIYEQLLDILKNSGKTGGIFFPHGLRKSTYDTCKECGRPRKPSATECTCGDTTERRSTGKTYYLDTSS